MVAAWHLWFFATRDAAGEGLVAIIHPWEAGRDKSIDWDAPIEYYDPQTTAPLGGGRFTWTAAMALEILAQEG